MKASEIAQFLSAELQGDPDAEITGIAETGSAQAGDLTFFSSGGIEAGTHASVAIVPTDFSAVSGLTIIRTKDPKLAFTKAAGLILPRLQPSGIDPRAVIAESADVSARHVAAFVTIAADSRVGAGTVLHAGVSIGANVKIGQNVTIHPNCVVYDDVEIGDGCVVHAGTVIGSDGFGYVKDVDGRHLQFPQRGRVLIASEVEIGANCTIDRGSLGVTRIGRGTKIDNLVHIAHNVSIGERVLIAGQSGIAGSCIIEDDVVIAGQVGVADHVTIRSGAAIGAKSAVYPNKIVRKGLWAGNPARPIDRFLHDLSSGREIDRIKEEIRSLRARIGGDRDVLDTGALDSSNLAGGRSDR